MIQVLALDSSGTEAGVCILDSKGRLLAERRLDEGLTHSETLLPLVEDTLKDASLTPADIGLYAVSAGPGSFTGLRIGMALSKGMALPGDTPLAPISTLEAIALTAWEALSGEPLPAKCLLIPVLNARRNEVYWAGFEARGGVTRIVPDTAGPVAGLDELLSKTYSPIFLVGSGAQICYNEYKEKYDVWRADLTAPIARGVARAALVLLERVGPLPADRARLSYLRLSQAERNRQKQLACKQDTKEHSP